MPNTVLKIHMEEANGTATATDEELMQRYALEDTAAFEELFHRHKNSVYAFIRGFAYTGEIRDDLFQNVFIRVAKNRKMYKPVAKFTTWLFTITRSVCIDAMRKNRRNNIISLTPPGMDPQPEEIFHEPASESPSPREKLYNTELQETLWQIIQSLPEAQRKYCCFGKKPT